MPVAPRVAGPSLLFPLLVSLLLPLGCHDVELSSAWRRGEIDVDGQKADWAAIDVYNFKSEGALLGVVNDEESLFLLVVTSDRMLGMQALSHDLTAEFRAEGEEGGGIRLRFPPPGGGMLWGRQDRQTGGGDSGAPPEPSRARPPEGERMPPPESTRRPSEILVLGPGERDTLRLSAAQAAAEGIQERGGEKDGTYALELKVPLAVTSTHPHAIGIGPSATDRGPAGQTIRVCLHVPKAKAGGRPSGVSGPGGSPGGGWMSFQEDDGDSDPEDLPGGRGGRPAGRGGFPGGPRPGSGTSRPNGLDLRLVIRLSCPPSNGPDSLRAVPDPAPGR